MSFSLSWQDVLSWCHVLVSRLSAISDLGKTFFRDIISQQDDFPWHHISVKRLSMICYLGKIIFPRDDILKRRHSEIRYRGETSFHVRVIAERRRFISVFCLFEIKYLGNTKTRMVTLSLRRAPFGVQICTSEQWLGKNLHPNCTLSAGWKGKACRGRCVAFAVLVAGRCLAPTSQVVSYHEQVTPVVQGGVGGKREGVSIPTPVNTME